MAQVPHPWTEIQEVITSGCVQMGSRQPKDALDCIALGVGSTPAHCPLPWCQETRFPLENRPLFIVCSLNGPIHQDSLFSPRHLVVHWTLSMSHKKRRGAGFIQHLLRLSRSSHFHTSWLFCFPRSSASPSPTLPLLELQQTLSVYSIFA